MSNINKNKIQQQDEILKAIEIMITAYNKDSKYDKTQWGIITAINVDGTYAVTHNGEVFDLTAVSGLTLAINDVVLVFVPNGNFSQRFILCKRPF